MSQMGRAFEDRKRAAIERGETNQLFGEWMILFAIAVVGVSLFNLLASTATRTPPSENPTNGRNG